MKKFFSKGIGLILILAVLVVAGYFINVEVQSYFGQQALAKADLQNHTLAAALDKAKVENKLVLVDVSAIWCPTCRRLDNDVLADQKVRERINAKYVFSRLEYESAEGTAFLEQHNAVGFPNLWLLDGDGKTIRKLQVTFNPLEFLAQIP